jgi:hypothetical protein
MKTWSKSAQGAVSDLGHEFEITATTIGEKFTPYIKDAAIWMGKHKQLVEDLTLAMIALTGAYFGVKIALDIVKTAQEAFNLVADADPWVLIAIAIAAVIAGLVIAYMKVKWFRDLVNAVFHEIKVIVGAVIDFVKEHWRLMLVVMFGLLGLFVDFVIKHWKTIVDIVKWAVHAIATVFGAVYGFITGPLEKAFNWIVSKVKWLAREVGKVLGPLLGPIKAVAGVVGGAGHAVGGAVHAVTSFLGLQEGGYVTAPGVFTVGEAGPENVYLPVGTAVTPHQGGGGETVIHNYLVVDGRVLAQAVARAGQQQLAVR